MLGHVLERLYGYTVMDAGYTVQCVLNTDWAAINYAFLEYKLQRIVVDAAGIHRRSRWTTSNWSRAA